MSCAPAASRWPPQRSWATCSKAPSRSWWPSYFLGREAAMCAALGAFLGHLFPVWLKFKGGKGVATYIGLLLGLAWPAAIAFCVVWLARRRPHPLFVTCRAHCQRRNSLLSLVARRSGGSRTVRAAVTPVVDHAPRKYRAAAPWQRKQDRLALTARDRALTPAGTAPWFHSPPRALLRLCSGRNARRACGGLCAKDRTESVLPTNNGSTGYA